MATNLTIESPNLQKIREEAGQFTSDAVNVLWAALNDTRAVNRRGVRRAQEVLEPKVLSLAPSASVDNLDITGYSVVSFTGSSAVNFTGMRAPETGSSRVVFVHVSGSATITAIHEATSETLNQLSNDTGANKALATRGHAIYCYLAGKWREIG